MARVDDDSYERLCVYKWHARKKVLLNRTVWYAVRMAPRANGRQASVQMHREILGVAGSVLVDHRDGDTLNNQRGNLRPASRRQNKQNSHKQKACSSQFKGVCWDRKNEKWQAYIRISGGKRHLGLFDVEEVAAKTYDAAARVEFGDFALTNFR